MGNFTSDHLTSLDLDMIEISWSFVRDKQHLGLNTMVKLFESSKEIKELFLFAVGTMDDIIENTKVRYHANQLVRTLNKIVMLMIKTPNCELERDQEKEKLIELGQRHYHYGIKKEHFKIFENCFIQSLEESLQVDTFQEKFENPWRKLMHFIFKQYTDGMNFEKKEEIKS